MCNVKNYVVGAGIFLGLTLVYTGMGRAVADAAKEALIVNTPAQAVPVHDINNPPRQPFQKEIIVNLIQGSDTGEEFVFTVPAGKRLVVEHASATAFVPVGQKVRMFLVSRLNSQLTSEALVATPQGIIDNGRDVFVASHPVRLYAGSGDFVRAVAIRSDSAVNGFVFFSVAGYLIDEP
jgi:hypothetical protein